jgi:hypothetical protein
MTDVNAWSTVADSNNTVSPDGFPEGNMQFSGVNDSWREVMAAEAKLWKDTNGSLVATGSANNYSVQLNSGYTSYFIGMTFACSIPAANTDTSGIVYLTVATTVGGGSYGLGSKQIIYDDLNADYVYNVLGASRFLLPHALTTGKIYRFCYDGTYLRLLDVPDHRALQQFLASGNTTLAIGDRGSHLYTYEGGGHPITWTIPDNSAVPFPIGTRVDFVNLDTRTKTINMPGSDSMAGPSGVVSSLTLAARGWAYALKVTATAWIVRGSVS